MASTAFPKPILRISAPCSPSSRAHEFFLPLSASSSHSVSLRRLSVHAKKKNSRSEPVLKPTIIEEIRSVDEEEDEEEELLLGDFDDEEFDGDEDDNFEDEFPEDDTLYVGDGAGGGGISLAGTWWDKEALAIAEEVTQSFDGELQIYAFKTLSNSTIQVRIETLSNKSGSPSMEDIEAFSLSYRTRLDEAELAKSVPGKLSLEVSSPGVERVVRVPYDLDRFKERPMFVKYTSEVSEGVSPSESDGIFRLISFDIDARSCTWGLADVRVNREKAGKGRPLSKKQREWRLNTSFDSLRLVRLYSEI
ncbi:uncharacterized protein LOC116205011 isoform X1 [Punica granatum]|uniref:Uncharacterized protein LOC116205011 isoform X1 n=1 Tax=Punica granatum TaxID=22663 RepID=A0A218XK29_PUNGR|nr:uncharacterized protein LOC116205011 isoform X1 [Punica granatum]OWM85076.1 hypothetical protein CDL15_Pgr027863 [Punica granatum]